MSLCYIKIKGVTPLLCNNPINFLISGGELDTEDGEKKKKKKTIKPGQVDFGTPLEQAEKVCYRLPDGNLAANTDWFVGGLKSAAYYFPATDLKQHRTYKSVVAHVYAHEEFVPMLGATGKPSKNLVVDSRVVILKGQIAKPAHRPRFEHPWFVEFHIDFREEHIIDPENVFESILADAGRRYGAGSFRPAKGGRFGQYEVMDCYLVDHVGQNITKPKKKKGTKRESMDALA
jgi:hypothetical protein